MRQYLGGCKLTQLEITIYLRGGGLSKEGVWKRPPPTEENPVRLFLTSSLLTVGLTQLFLPNSAPSRDRRLQAEHVAAEERAKVEIIHTVSKDYCIAGDTGMELSSTDWQFV